MERSMTYFDNGATSFPKPKSVEEAMLRGIRNFGANPGRSGHRLSMETAMQVYRCREAAAGFFGAMDPAHVVFTSNCTHSLNLAIKGRLRAGDHVIISDLEHNSVLRPIHAIAARGQITYSVAEACEDEDETVKAFERMIKPETRLIACTHGSNVWGIKLPVGRIGKMARERGIAFLVDAAQTAGVVDIDVTRDCIDFLCASGHKGLYGPPGTGLLITSRGHELATIIEGGTGTMSADFCQPPDMPERLECGTVNTVGIMGLMAGIEYLQCNSIAEIYSHEMRIAKMIYERLRDMDNVTVYTKRFFEGTHLPVVSFNIDGMPSEDVVAALSECGFALRGGLHCAVLAHKKMGTDQTGAVRVSVGAFNTMEQGKLLLAQIVLLAQAPKRWM